MFNPNHVYLRPVMEILPLPIQMQLSGKKKTFCSVFISFLEFTLNSWLRKLWLPKWLKCLVSENHSGVNPN